jgi:hypothetical protein
MPPRQTWLPWRQFCCKKKKDPAAEEADAYGALAPQEAEEPGQDAAYDSQHWLSPHSHQQPGMEFGPWLDDFLRSNISQL